VKKPFDLRDDPLIRVILAKVWKGWIPRLDSRVGSCWMMRIWGFDQGPNLRCFEMILESCPSIPNMCYVFLEIQNMFLPCLASQVMGCLEMSSTVVKIQGLRSEWSALYPKPVD
jgi:hypothetical protein